MLQMSFACSTEMNKELFILIFLSLFCIVKAQGNSELSNSVVAVISVFSTIGFFLILLLLYFLIEKCRKKNTNKPSTISGHDNILVVTDDDEKNFPSPSDASSKLTSSIRNVLLDQKQTPTNGFDVLQDSNNEIVISNIRVNGPADGKLKEGDFITSITVLFEDIKYEDAVALLSKAAPYKVVVSVERKKKKILESETDADAKLNQSETLQQKAYPIKKEQAPKYLKNDEGEKSPSTSCNAELLDQTSNPINYSTSRITPIKKRDDIEFTSGWRKKVKLTDLLEVGLVDEETVKKLEYGDVTEDEIEVKLRQYLKGHDPIAGVLIVANNSKMSFYDATKEKLLRRATAVNLLEAQAATGSIINPYNSSKMNVEQATIEGLIDTQLAAVLSRVEKAVLGFKTMKYNQPLSLFEAMKRKLIMESHGIRLLEAQIATGGIIDPNVNLRLPLETAFERGLFDEKLHRILDSSADDRKVFFDPNTQENLTYLELIERCILDDQTGLNFLPIYEKEQKKGYWKYQI